MREFSNSYFVYILLCLSVIYHHFGFAADSGTAPASVHPGVSFDGRLEQSDQSLTGRSTF